MPRLPEQIVKSTRIRTAPLRYSTEDGAAVRATADIRFGKSSQSTRQLRSAKSKVLLPGLPQRLAKKKGGGGPRYGAAKRYISRAVARAASAVVRKAAQVAPAMASRASDFAGSVLRDAAPRDYMSRVGWLQTLDREQYLMYLDAFDPDTYTRGLAPKPKERDIQRVVVRLAREIGAMVQYNGADIGLVLAHPETVRKRVNGMNAQHGYARGIPDLAFFEPRYHVNRTTGEIHTWHGLFIELKRAPGIRGAPHQEEYIDALRCRDFLASVVGGVDNIVGRMMWYLRLPRTKSEAIAEVEKERAARTLLSFRALARFAQGGDESGHDGGTNSTDHSD